MTGLVLLIPGFEGRPGCVHVCLTGRKRWKQESENIVFALLFLAISCILDSGE